MKKDKKSFSKAIFWVLQSIISGLVIGSSSIVYSFLDDQGANSIIIFAVNSIFYLVVFVANLKLWTKDSAISIYSEEKFVKSILRIILMMLINLGIAFLLGLLVNGVHILENPIVKGGFRESLGHLVNILFGIIFTSFLFICEYLIKRYKSKSKLVYLIVIPFLILGSIVGAKDSVFYAATLSTKINLLNFFDMIYIITGNLIGMTCLGFIFIAVPQMRKNNEIDDKNQKNFK